MNRRSFLAAAAATAFAPATFVRAAERRRRVVVVGAGLADLSCAYELRKLGFEVVVLEGRAGGRVQTLREGLDAELSAEAGATRIPDTHWMTLAYVREFGLTLEPFKSGDLADVVHLRGRNYVAGHGPEPEWPLQLNPEERRLGRRGMAERYMVEGHDNSSSARATKHIVSVQTPDVVRAVTSVHPKTRLLRSCYRRENRKMPRSLCRCAEDGFIGNTLPAHLKLLQGLLPSSAGGCGSFWPK
jgi:hypothetical protein